MLYMLGFASEEAAEICIGASPLRPGMWVRDPSLVSFGLAERLGDWMSEMSQDGGGRR